MSTPNVLLKYEVPFGHPDFLWRRFLFRNALLTSVFPFIVVPALVLSKTLALEQGTPIDAEPTACTTEVYDARVPLVVSGVLLVFVHFFLCLASARWSVTPPSVEPSVMMMSVVFALARMPIPGWQRLFFAAFSIPYTLRAWNTILPFFGLGHRRWVFIIEVGDLSLRGAGAGRGGQDVQSRNFLRQYFYFPDYDY